MAEAVYRVVSIDRTHSPTSIGPSTFNSTLLERVSGGRAPDLAEGNSIYLQVPERRWLIYAAYGSYSTLLGGLVMAAWRSVGAV